MENESITKLILKLSPPVMLSLLIQSLYNIVDSFFVARYDTAGITALSIIFPFQLLMIAISTGTGVGVNILISRYDGLKETKKQDNIMKSGLVLALIHFLLFALIGNLIISSYFAISSDNILVRSEGVLYTRIVLTGALGTFIEAICTKILQARGNMLLPMAAQVSGALLNIALDPIIIFGKFGAPELGIGGAAIATIAGQWLAMFITLIPVIRKYGLKGRFSVRNCFRIYQNGIGSIVTQSLYTVYIFGLNMILKGFSNDAVTVLGIYYKLQNFFFIPMSGFTQVLLPIVSFNYGAGKLKKAREVFIFSVKVSCTLMLISVLAFLTIPDKLLLLFSANANMVEIGNYAFRVIALSFVPLTFILMITTYFQGIARMKESVFLVVLRMIFLFVPIAWLLHFLGLKAFWWTFPITECIVTITAIVFDRTGSRKNGPAEISGKAAR